MADGLTLYRGHIAHFPHATGEPTKHLQSFKDGALIINQSKILAVGNYADLAEQYADAELVDYRGKLIIPGLIDSHLHFPQTEMIASYGEQLLSWLENFTFPTENKFADPSYCDYIAEVFLNQLVKNGTTTALAYATVHGHSVDALFNAATRKNMSMVAGKVCMDQNCPEYLQDTPHSAQQDSAQLIEKWHGKGRNLYAITPRFAPTSSAQQMAALGELAQQYDDVFIQTHLSESKAEIAWVRSLYPEHEHYLDVYDHYHMVRKRAVFGHGVHLPDESWQRLYEANATIAFCPSSNLFLGSGLFDTQKAQDFSVNVALASDVGAGTSFNLLRTYGDAYKVSHLQGVSLNPLQGLYMMTQGPAHAYGLAEQIGNLNPGSYADFVVLDPGFDELTALRIKEDASTDDVIFALAFLGDDRAVVQTYIAGQPSISDVN